MCVNYRPPPRPQLAASFGVEVFDLPSWPDEAWKDYASPIIRLSAEGDHEATVGTYGIVPRRHIPDGVRPFDTMNARLDDRHETIVREGLAERANMSRADDMFLRTALRRHWE